MSDELKPCAHCAKPGIEVEQRRGDFHEWSIECSGCYCRTDWYSLRDAAIFAWNARADDAPEQPVDNARADSRERLEEAMHNVIRDALLNLKTAIMHCVEQGMDVLSFDEGEFVDYEHDEYVGEYLSRAMRLLDRQAAITEREYMEQATTRYIGLDCAECAEGLGKELDARCDPLKERIAELTAERDRLRAELQRARWNAAVEAKVARVDGRDVSQERVIPEPSEEFSKVAAWLERIRAEHVEGD